MYICRYAQSLGEPNQRITLRSVADDEESEFVRGAVQKDPKRLNQSVNSLDGHEPTKICEADTVS